MSWRELLPVHPAAELLPRMSEEELRELADDIAANGLRRRVDLITRPDGKVALLDGISRLDALELLGREICFEAPKGNCTGGGDALVWKSSKPKGWGVCGELPQRRYRLSDQKAVAFVISTNIKRRHLDAEQRRELIARLLKLAPEKSNRQIAKTAGAHHETVGSVRTDLEGRGEIRHVETRTDTKGREQPAKKIRPRDADNIEAMRLESAWEKASPGGRELFMKKVGLVYAEPADAITKIGGAADGPRQS